MPTDVANIDYQDTESYDLPIGEVVLWRSVANIDYSGGTDATAPVLSNVTPAAGSELNYSTGVFGFDATDPGGNLTRCPTVLAWYPELRLFEVVYFASAIPEFAGGFAPAYLGSMAGIALGFRFSNVQRRGGWPSRPIFVVDPTDDAGNVSA